MEDKYPFLDSGTTYVYFTKIFHDKFISLFLKNINIKPMKKINS